MRLCQWYAGTSVRRYAVVLFLFNDNEEEVGRYYISKKLQGLTPEEITEIKDTLAFFESWNPETKQWVPCIGYATNAKE